VRNDIRSPIASLLCFVLLSLSAQPLFGQSAPAPQSLHIVILGSEGAHGEPMVRVGDDEHRPVAGAFVVFTAAPGSGEFANGAQSLTVTTDQQGRAMATGFRPNNQAGEFVLQVLATFAGLRAETTIRQTTVSATAPAPDGGEPEPAAHRSTSKWILIGALVAGGVLVGGFAAGRGGSSSKSVPTGVTITPGAATVGAAPK
jgi:hypothetical protein